MIATWTQQLQASDPGLADALELLIEQVYASSNIETDWYHDEDTPDLISTSDSIISALKILAAAVEDITGGNAVVFKGVSTTALTDG